MKEIFNDIRNKVGLCSDEACFIPDDTEVIAESRLKQILDEAEAKWEAVIEQMEEYRAKFDCRVCKHTKTEGQVCTKDCTDALIDGMLEIVRKGGVE